MTAIVSKLTKIQCENICSKEKKYNEKFYGISYCSTTKEQDNRINKLKQDILSWYKNLNDDQLELVSICNLKNLVKNA